MGLDPRTVQPVESRYILFILIEAKYYNKLLGECEVVYELWSSLLQNISYPCCYLHPQTPFAFLVRINYEL